MQKAIQVAKLAALTTVAVLAITLSVCVWRVSTEVTGAVGHIRLAAARAEKLAATYEEELASDKNRKAIEAGIAAAASWQATARLVNTTTIPAINRTLGELEATGRELAALVEEQNGNFTTTTERIGATIQSSDESIRRIGPAIDKIGLAAERLGEQIDTIGADTSRTLNGIAPVIQHFEGVSRNFEETSARLAEIGENLRVASESAPGIARGVEKVASKAPWYQKLAAYGGLLMGIGSLVWR